VLATATALCYYCGKTRLKASAAAKEATRAAKKQFASHSHLRCLLCTADYAYCGSNILFCMPRNRIPHYIDDAEIQQMSARSEYSTEAQRTLAESALMLVGKVNYFWGGKSYTVGWDDRWGKPAEVTSPGHSTSGTTIPYGLDCSGFVLWCYIQLGADKTETIEKIGVGTWNQWDKSAEIKKSDVRIGDLAFINKYPGSDGNHVGICVGFLKNGEPLIAHCSATQNKVVVSTCGSEFKYFRRPCSVLTAN